VLSAPGTSEAMVVGICLLGIVLPRITARRQTRAALAANTARDSSMQLLQVSRVLLCKGSVSFQVSSRG
jgi:hypothetical protein